MKLAFEKFYFYHEEKITIFNRIFRNISNAKVCYNLWREKIQYFHIDGARTSDPSLGQRGPRTDPEQVYVLCPSLPFFPSVCKSESDWPTTDCPSWHVIQRETGFLSHMSGGRRSLGGRQEWGTVQVPGHDSRPWSVHDFIPRSMVFRVRGPSKFAGPYAEIFERGESIIQNGRLKRLSDSIQSFIKRIMFPSIKNFNVPNAA